MLKSYAHKAGKHVALYSFTHTLVNWLEVQHLLYLDQRWTTRG